MPIFFNPGPGCFIEGLVVVQISLITVVFFWSRVIDKWGEINERIQQGVRSS
jgi:hypothetical protein